MSKEYVIPSAIEQDVSDIATAKMVADHLEKHYPGYLWAVNASAFKGVVYISSLRLSGKYGYTLHFPSFENDPSLKRITQAGGEILERFKVRIGGVNNLQLDEKRQVAGEFAFDYHEMTNSQKPSDGVRMRWDHFQ